MVHVPHMCGGERIKYFFVSALQYLNTNVILHSSVMKHSIQQYFTTIVTNGKQS